MAEPAHDTPYTIVCRTDDEREWLQHRLSGIGASEMPILLGASDWGSNLDIYYSKVDGVDEARPQTEWMQWGKLLERTIVDELGRRAGVFISRAEVLLRSKAHPWALASLDDMTAAGEPVEVKNLAWGFDAEEWADGIPEKYFIQCQQQLLVSGASRNLFGALLHGQRLVWEWIPRHEPTIQRIITAGEAFWRRVLEKRPPPSDGHPNARKRLARLDKSENDAELDEDEARPLILEWTAAESALREIRAQERKAEKARDAAADRIAQLVGPRRSASLGDWSFKWETVSRNGYTVEPKTFEQFKIKPPK